MRGKPGVPWENPLELERRTDKCNPHFTESEIKQTWANSLTAPLTLIKNE